MRTRRIAVLLALCGCTAGPDFERPSLWSPASWFGPRHPALGARPTLSLPVAEPVDPEWWAALGDPVLTGLMRRAAASNFDVRAASIRLAESRAQRGIAGAALSPQVNANASYARERPSENGVISLFTGGAGAGPAAASSNGLGGRQGGIPSSSNPRASLGRLNFAQISAAVATGIFVSGRLFKILSLTLS